MVPRYITIRIQYYPIPKSVLLILFSIFVLFVFVPFVNQLYKESKSMKYESRKFTKVITIPGYESLLAQAFNPAIKGENKNEEMIFHGPRDKKKVALTFDADMTPEMKYSLETGEVVSYVDNRLIDILQSTQTKATLFLTGLWIETYPDKTRELGANPLFELASHSYSHPSFDGTCYGLRQISDVEDGEEIQRAERSS